MAACACKAFLQLMLERASVSVWDPSIGDPLSVGATSLQESAMLEFAAKRWSEATAVKLRLTEQSLAAVQAALLHKPPQRARSMCIAW